jgi:hypothetical protein
MKGIIGYVVLALVCFALGALAVGLRASARIARAEARLRALPKTISVTREQIERFVGGSLCKAMDSEEMVDAVQCFFRCLGIGIRTIEKHEGD